MRKIAHTLITATCLIWLSAAPLAEASLWEAELLRDHPLAGKIYEPSTGKFISDDELRARIAKARYLLLGEIHDNVEHHALQAGLIYSQVQNGRKPDVVMEMLGAEQADLVANLNASRDQFYQDTAAAKELGKWWAKSGWPDFEKYSVIFGVAHRFNLKFVVGEPAPPKPDRITSLLENAPLNPEHSAALHEELITSHCGVLPETVIPKIAVAQRKRDIKLALAMVEAAKHNKGGTVLIAGSGHARKDRGVPHYLRKLGEKSVTVNFREVAKDKTAPADLIDPGEADYIWFTPRQKREDPCVALRKQFGKTKE